MLKLSSVSKHFGGRAVLNAVTLEVAAGEYVAILGESGIGKSTLLNAIAGLEPVDSGRIVFDKEEITAMDDDALALLRRDRFGFVFQTFNLIAVLSALENVEYPLTLGRMPGATAEQRARELLERVGLGERLDHRPGQLSGGERQRTAVARALVTRPAAVLADEPTGNLDRPTGLKVFELLLELNAALGTSLIVVTHDPDLAKRMDRVLELKDGVLRPVTA
jgi:lipoprotein-releasing system ATP-binding protein